MMAEHSIDAYSPESAQTKLMGASIQEDLKKLLAQQPVQVDIIDSQRPDAMQFVPLTKRTMGYIMTTILFNDAGHVLMVQEAKPSCRGKWYLPAGRLEPGENFVDGAKREVKEEAGLDCEITTLLSVHNAYTSWMRMAFTGRITGGKLKTTAEQDEESLQAQFFPVKDIELRAINLRALDVIPLIHQAVNYRKTSNPINILPVVIPHTHILHRTVIAAKLENTSTLYVLAGTRQKVHVPVSTISKKDSSLSVSLLTIISEALDKNQKYEAPLLCGILGVEHCGAGSGQHDGLCLTSFAYINIPQDHSLPKLSGTDFSWVPLSSEPLVETLLRGRQGDFVILTEK